MANRITLGLVLAALIVGAALLMRVETTFRLFGYPGFAMSSWSRRAAACGSRSTSCLPTDREGALSGSRRVVRAVLFDLDDTLFDHSGCAREALSAVHSGHACFAGIGFEAFERAHAAYLEELHQEVMFGRLPLEDARRERFRRLFNAYDVDAGRELAGAAASMYRDRYRESRRTVQGAAALLRLVKTRARVGVVSNNLLAEQQEKIAFCGIEAFVDALVVSEEAGVAKPDPAIFTLALDRLGCRAEDAVMIGDSWSADVAGARAAGIRAVWFNRLGEAPPDVDPAVGELRSLEPADAALRVIFDAHRD